jgi:hypothetical protein
MKVIQNIHNEMKSEHLMLAYQGDFSQETVKCILALGERTMALHSEDSVVKRKVFNVMVESLQNIVRHNDASTETQRQFPAIFLIGREPKSYSIMSGNPVSKERVPELQTALEGINKLDKDGLKDLYKNIIKGTTLSEKGGAGLGFVDMARKSGEKLSYDFPEISESYCFFCLKVNIPLVS